MKNKYKIVVPLSLIISLYFLGSVNLSAAPQFETETKTETIELELDWNDSKAAENVNLEDYISKLKKPDECGSPNIICEENLKVEMKISKTFFITKLNPLDSPNLLPEDFSKYYPDIESCPIDKSTDPKNIMILQRILYERGMLDTLPTGKYGVLTELAVHHFQQLKGLSQCSKEAAVIDCATVEALNELKHKMSNSGYLSGTLVPPFDENALCEEESYRVYLLNKYLEAVKNGDIKPVIESVSDEDKKVEAGTTGRWENKTYDTIQLEGFVKIKK